MEHGEALDASKINEGTQMQGEIATNFSHLAIENENETPNIMEQIYLEIHFEAAEFVAVSKKVSTKASLFDTAKALEILSKLSVLGKSPRLEYCMCANLGSEMAVAYRTTPDKPLSADVMSLVGSEFPELKSFAHGEHLKSFTLDLCKRYADVVITEYWVFLSILSHSRTFRKAALGLDCKSWNSLVTSILANAVSLEVFAKVRSLDIETPLNRVSSHLTLDVRKNITSKQRQTPSIRPGHFQAYVVSTSMESVDHPRFRGKL